MAMEVRQRVLPVSVAHRTRPHRDREDGPGPGRDHRAVERAGPDARCFVAWPSRPGAAARSRPRLALAARRRVRVRGRRRRRRRDGPDAARGAAAAAAPAARARGRDSAPLPAAASTKRAVDDRPRRTPTGGPSPSRPPSTCSASTDGRSRTAPGPAQPAAPAIKPKAAARRRRLATSRPPETTISGRRVHRPEPRLDPGARASAGRSRRSPAAAPRARQLRLPLGLRRHEQRLPPGPRLGRVQAPPRRLHSGRLKVGMKVWLRRRNGRVRTYAVRWWKVVKPTTAASWAWAAQSTPSMTLQTCVGAQSQNRLMVRLTEVG